MSTTIDGYDYPPPNRSDFKSALTRVLGEEEAERAWIHACDVASISPTLGGPLPDDLTAVAHALRKMGGLHSVVGNSMYVRLLTYQTLAKRSAAAAQGGSRD